jgi:hypothetical protein
MYRVPIFLKIAGGALALGLTAGLIGVTAYGFYKLLTDGRKAPYEGKGKSPQYV